MSPTKGQDVTAGVSSGIGGQLRPILYCVGGSVCLSINDMGVKLLSGGYALHQVMLFRTLVAALVVLAVIRISGTPWSAIRTRRPLAHLARISLIVVSGVAFFMGLAVMPLAEGIAVGFVAPLLVTAMSVVLLGERVGPRRWAAVAVGMVGVVVILRPGTGVIQPAALLVLLGAALYAGGHMMTRVMKGTESTFTLNVGTILGFLVVSSLMGLIAGSGRFAGSADPSVQFLLRAWVWPPLADLAIMAILGVAVAGGGLMITHAYRLGEAALVAPFEYTAMPLAVFWGLLFFAEWPDGTAWMGIALILMSGVYLAWREARVKR
jgi:drug/metabolite transporter (DMT)-like permease